MRRVEVLDYAQRKTMRSTKLLAASAAVMAVFIAGLSSLSRADTSVTAFDPLVRVHLARFYAGATSLAVTADSPFCVAPSGVSATAVSPITTSTDRSVTIDAAGSGMASSSSTHEIALSPGESVVLTGSDPANGIFSLRQGDSARRYRGSLTVSCTSAGSLRVIDCLPLEEYLKGVLGPEIGSSAPLEALKAQAVAARTYAVKNFDHNTSPDADLEDTTQNQLYDGYDSESARCDEAIDATAGKVITFNGELIDAVYATDCGGITADGGEPYLKPVVDADCAQETPWTVTVSLSDLSSDLERAGVNGLTGAVSSLSVAEKDASGRIATIRVGQSGGADSVSVSGSVLRRAVGYDKLKSTLFDVSTDSGAGSVTFIGHGWGHGAGMCQHGAIYMARAGAATYTQILTHYYTGVEISDLNSDDLQCDGDSGREGGFGLSRPRPAASEAADVTAVTASSGPRHAS
jgi:stage II sporulation protein D